MVMLETRRVVLVSAFAAVTAVAPTASFAVDTVQGRVVRTELTLCQPRPTGGGCEGTLTLEANTGGTAQEVAIRVQTDTIIRKGRDHLFLPATQGSSVVVSYVTERGQKVARSIDVVDAAR
jgi:hypothetical protein